MLSAGPYVLVYILSLSFFLPFAASADSPAATVDSETITLNSGTLQAFEILPVSNRELVFVSVVFLLGTATTYTLELCIYQKKPNQNQF